MSGILYNIFHPEIFQGSLSRKKYFEGWYYKIVSSGEKHAIAVIPGIALSDEQDRHAFIQIFNGATHSTNYHRFPLDDFTAGKKELDISIGKNHFTKNSMHLDLPELKGDIFFSNMVTPASSLLSPGVMGWFAFVPRMQCYHGVVSLHHQLTGITSGGYGDIQWEKGIGYIEKDWGTSFPLSWIWIHCNHFTTKGTDSLMASVAHIPWMGKYFPGFIVVFRVDEKEYRFATYNYSMMKCLVHENIVVLDFRRKDLNLSIKAYRGETAALHTPIQGQMAGKLNESLRARVEVTLMQRGQEIWSSSGTTAGLDISGDISILQSVSWRK